MAEVATPLALVLVELLQNAAEHGLGDDGGTVRVEVRRADRRQDGEAPHEILAVTVSDDGPGPPPGFSLAADSDGLGLQIVRTLAETELGGELALLPRPEPVAGQGSCGAQIRVSMPLPAPPGDSPPTFA